MATVQEIIDSAFDIAMGNKTPSDTQRSTALKTLNVMLDALSIDRGVIYVTTRDSQTLVVGTSEYTIGSGGDWATTRPVHIENAYIRDTNNNDFPVYCITRDEYARINLKNIEARPTEVVYVPEYPLGKLWFNHEADAAETFIFDSWQPFTAFTGLGQTVTWPPGYQEMFEYQLALRLAGRYGAELSRADERTAIDSLEKIRRINVVIPTSTFDFRRRRDERRYNSILGG